MRTLTLLILAMLTGCYLPSCTVGPTVARTPKGGYIASAGGTLFAKKQNVLTEIATVEGDVIRHSNTSEDSTEVPMSAIRWKYSFKMLKTQQPAILKGTDDPDFIPKDPNKIPKDPNIIPLDPNKLPQ